MDVTIRKIKHTDFKRVQNFAKESWRATYAGIIPLHIQNKFLQEACNDAMMERRLNIRSCS